MNRIATMAAAALLLTTAASAQEATLLDRNLDHGGFGGPVVKVARINGEPGVMVGGAGAWIIDHRAFVGIEGTSLINKVEGKTVQSSGDPYILGLNEGGIRLGYIHRSDDALHLTASALFGAGSMTLSERYVWTDGQDFAWDVDRMYFIAEPEIAAELNVTDWMRVQLGASYRFVTGANFEGMQSSDLSGPSGSFSLKFGSF